MRPGFHTAICGVESGGQAGRSAEIELSAATAEKKAP